MKNFALVIAFVLLAAVSASAAEISKAAPATPALEQPTQGAPLLFEANFKVPVLTPYCSSLHGTSCPAAGATTACTDVCHNQLSCTCYNIYAPPYYVTVVGRYWYCDYEC